MERQWGNVDRSHIFFQIHMMTAREYEQQDFREEFKVASLVNEAWYAHY